MGTCYMCSDRTINALAHSIVHFGIDDNAKSTYGKMFRENDRSVSHRTDASDRLAVSGYSETIESLPISDIYSLCTFYSYQSEYSPLWRASFSKRCIEELKKSIEAVYMRRNMPIPAGPWGID